MTSTPEKPEVPTPAAKPGGTKRRTRSTLGRDHRAAAAVRIERHAAGIDKELKVRGPRGEAGRVKTTPTHAILPDTTAQSKALREAARPQPWPAGPHDPTLRAFAIAQVVAGRSSHEVAREIGVAERTVAHWATIFRPSLPTVLEIETQALSFLRDAFAGARSIAQLATDDQWLQRQSGRDLALLADVLADRSTRLLAALRQGADRQQQAELLAADGGRDPDDGTQIDREGSTAQRPISGME